MKKVTKEEVKRALEKEFGLAYTNTQKRILNELFPPEFKVGEYLCLDDDGLGACEKGSVCKVVDNDCDDWTIKVEWVSKTTQENGAYFKSRFRHAAPEEIAEAEWEEGAVYKVYWEGIWYVRIASDEIGWFYCFGSFCGATSEYITYEKLVK